MIVFDSDESTGTEMVSLNNVDLDKCELESVKVDINVVPVVEVEVDNNVASVVVVKEVGKVPGARETES